MKQKLITLCDKSFARAKAMPNFSRWVRRQLLTDDLTSADASDLIAFWHTIADGLMKKHGEDIGSIMKMRKDAQKLAEWLMEIEDSIGWYK